MAATRGFHVCWSAILFVALLLYTQPTYARYSGGTGEPNDPYRIATAQDLAK